MKNTLKALGYKWHKYAKTKETEWTIKDAGWYGIQYGNIRFGVVQPHQTSCRECGKFHHWRGYLYPEGIEGTPLPVSSMRMNTTMLSPIFNTIEEAQAWVEEKLVSLIHTGSFNNWNGTTAYTSPTVAITVKVSGAVLHLVKNNLQDFGAEISDTVNVEYQATRTYTWTEERRAEQSRKIKAVWAKRKKHKEANDKLISTLMAQSKGGKYIV